MAAASLHLWHARLWLLLFQFAAFCPAGEAGGVSFFTV